MTPPILIENDSQSFPTPLKEVSSPRTLLLAPPSISSHEETLRNVLASYNRAITDLQMLDRLSAGLVTLPDATYDLILVLSDADGTRTESFPLLSRLVFSKILRALKAGGSLQAQDGTFGQDAASIETREAILAGLVLEKNIMIKPAYSASEAVPLRQSRRGKGVAVSDAGPPNLGPDTQSNGKRKVENTVNKLPPGVGLIDFGDDLGIDEDDELIDEDTLLTEEDMRRPVNIPPECSPRVGKRRRACKDCTCGLAEKIAAEDGLKRTNADEQLRTLKLGIDDLAEVDFTIQGKVGSCGNCSLGDAFRCDGCPYTGMPAFKVGDEVRLLNNDIQL